MSRQCAEVLLIRQRDTDKKEEYFLTLTIPKKDESLDPERECNCRWEGSP